MALAKTIRHVIVQRTGFSLRPWRLLAIISLLLCAFDA